MNNVISPLPTTADLLQFYAHKTPEKTALQWGKQRLTFAQLHEHLSRCTAFLKNQLPHLEKDQVVAVSTEDFLWQWVSLIALEQLGLCSMSVLPGEVNDEFMQQFAAAALIAPASHVLSVPVIIINYDTITPQPNEASLPTPEQDRAHRTALRLLRTSGTTGESKRIVLDRRMLSGWTERWQWFCNYGPHSICLIQHPFSIGGIYATATACLRAGGTVIKRDGRPFLQAVHDFDVSHATVLPMDLSSIVPESRSVPVIQRKIMLTAFGGVLPVDMVARCLEVFAHHVADMYGTNEVGFIGAQIAGLATSATTGITLLPGVEIGIVNDQDQALPPGEVGHIKVRTPHMAARYENDAGSTSAHFMDGWFWPGDMGRTLPSGRLELTGRNDDLINIGGIKVNPALAESNLRSLDYVRDAAVFMLPQPDGTQSVMIAVVFAATGHLERLRQDTAASLASFGKWLEWTEVETIPRTPTGKVQRGVLRAQMQKRRTETRQPDSA
jgi:acyl-coenzyme A synthetase/AMP-(fatty) acid ligase